MPDTNTILKQTLRAALGDLNILSGDAMGPSDVTWQDVAGTAAVNLRALANLLEAVRTGEHYQGCPLTGPVVFPSVAEEMGVESGAHFDVPRSEVNWRRK